MKALSIFIGGLITAGIVQNSIGQQTGNGTLSTPAFNGTGANPSGRGTSPFGATGTGVTRTNMNFGTSLTRPTTGAFGTNAGTNFGTVVGQPTGTALVPGSTAISAADATNAVTPLGTGTAVTTPNGSNTSIGLPNSSVGIGQQNATALGQPGTGAIGQQNTRPGQQNTTAPGQQGTVGIGQQSTTALGQQGTGTAITPQTNGFVVNADGSVVGIRSPVGGSAEAGLGGTNFGNSFGTNRFGTNAFGTNRFNPQTNRFNSAP